jgi:hypothetical protein
MKLKLKIALLAGICVANAAMAFDVADMDLPLLIHGADQAAGQGCPAVRALKPVELPLPWRAAVTRIVMNCEPMEGQDKRPDASTMSVASLRAGDVTLQGIPVVELRHGESWAHGDSQYVLGAPYAKVAEQLAAYAKARCAMRLGTEARTPEACMPMDDPVHGGLFFQTSELGGIRVHPDPDDPQQSIAAEAWSE